MKISYHITYSIIIIVLVVLLFMPFTKRNKVNGLDSSGIDTLSFKRDTLIFYKIDTLFQVDTLVKIEYKERIIKDTIKVKDTITNSEYTMPLVQKYFSEPNKYDLWISGIEPLNVDRINVYNQVEYRTITNTITQAIYPRRNEFYLGGGFCSFLRTFNPMVGVAMKTKKNVLISLDFGYYEGDALLLGTAKFKLGKN